MNTVIEFPRHRVNSTEPRSAAKPGDIVIFPGVRIERGAFSLADRLGTPPHRDPAPVKPREVETV